jgi:hypothetical protein
MPLFQRRRRSGPADLNAPLGLVVPARALQIFDPKTGELIYDELPLIEKAFLMEGRQPVIFIEDASAYNPDTDVSWLK